MAMVWSPSILMSGSRKTFRLDLTRHINCKRMKGADFSCSSLYAPFGTEIYTATTEKSLDHTSRIAGLGTHASGVLFCGAIRGTPEACVPNCIF
jgi:hypothetical protein